MKVYKGTNKDMTCLGYQFEIGKTAETDRAELCKMGFHACERPLDVLSYYAPGVSRYFAAELEDVSDACSSEDTKVVGKKITLKIELSIADLCKEQAEYVKKHTMIEHTDREAATAGDSGAATAGNWGAATAGDRGAATAGEYGAATAGYYGAATAGDRGAATAKGSVSVGENGCGLVRGNGVMIRGGLGAILVICEEEEDSYAIAHLVSVVVDGKTVKADTWYRLNNGELEEVTDVHTDQ